MLAIERLSIIQEQIREKGSVLVSDLAELFQVTTETIRGDLEKLEKQGFLVRTYGGAMLLEQSSNEMSLKEREVINSEGKSRIGKAAADLVKDGDCIFLDASTSALWLAQNLKGKSKLTVITYSERIISELSTVPDIKLICVGGEYSARSRSFFGRITVETIRENYCANKCFISCKGVNLTKGLLDSTEREADIKKAIIERSDMSVLLCDKSKLGVIGIQVISDLNKLDYIITDASLDEEWKQKFEELGIKIIYTF